jgi:hypothetical protein
MRTHRSGVFNLQPTKEIDMPPPDPIGTVNDAAQKTLEMNAAMIAASATMTGSNMSTNFVLGADQQKTEQSKNIYHKMANSTKLS